MSHRASDPPNEGGTSQLRYTLAHDGHWDSQVAVAKSLLDESTATNEQRFENITLAIHWLLRAAESGHNEAYSLLRKFYKTGFGITPLNKLSVEACLALKKKDIIAARIGYKVYRLTMSDTREDNTEEAFGEKVRSILLMNNMTPEHSAGNSGDGTNFNSEPAEEMLITEEPPAHDEEPLPPPCETATGGHKLVSLSDIVDSVKQCLDGNLPLVTIKNAVRYDISDHWLSCKKYVYSAWNSIFHFLEVFVKDLGSPTMCNMVLIFWLLCWAWDCIQKNKVNSFANVYDIFFTIFSFAAMVSCTCYIIVLQFGHYNVDKWLDLIEVFKSDVKSDEIREKYMGHTVFPLLGFFLASFAYNMLEPIYPIAKFFPGEFLLLSIFLFILVDKTITHRRYYVNISLILNGVLYLHKLNVFQFLYLPSVLDFDISLMVFEHYEIHVNWMTCVTLPFVLPYLYYAMARGPPKKGWLQTLLPHLVCLTWINLASDLAKSCNVETIGHGLLTWGMVFLTLKVFNMCISIIIIALIKVLAIVTGNVKIEICLHLVIIVLRIGTGIYHWLAEKVKGKKYFSKNFMSKTLSLLLFSFLAIVLLKNLIPGESSPDTLNSAISWNQYESYCHRNAWYHSNTADVQLECLPLKGKLISLEGTVTQIDLVQSRNHIAYVSYLLPTLISQWISCALGQPICGENDTSTLQKDRCRLFQNLKVDQCNLHNWDVQQYRIILEVTSRTSPEVVIIADDVCTAFIKNLKDGDSLHVVGSLQDGIGGTTPEILLKRATCNTCYDHRNCSVVPLSVPLDYTLAWRHLTEFYLSPFIQYLY